MDKTPAMLQERLERFLWGLTLLLMPLTSFRYLPFFGDSQVKPLSFLPVVLLIPIILYRSIRQKKFYFKNNAAVLLLVLLFVLLISSAAGAFLAPPNALDYTYMNRLTRAWITLLVGLTFFFVPVVMVRSEADLRFMLKWLFIGMLGHLLWALVQWVALHTSHVFIGELTLRGLVNLIQLSFNMAGITSTARSSGLALEPSWLAAQMVILYLPWAFSSVLTNYSFTRRRFVPVLLLALGLLLSAMSYSRSGILILVVSTLLTFFITGRETIASVLNWFFRPFKRQNITASKPLQIALRLSLLALVFILALGGGFLLSQNTYFSMLWQEKGDSLVDYLVNIYAGPRLAFAWAGWNIFTSHPWLGVGLGAGGFYFQSALPDWSHFNLSEVSMILSPDFTGFPNVKNLYIRLLAEGGLLAFWVWMAFNLYIFSRILKLLKSDLRYLRFTAVAGVFAFFSILLVNFTLDSFAMPLLWLPFGVIVGIQEGTQPGSWPE